MSRLNSTEGLEAVSAPAVAQHSNEAAAQRPKERMGLRASRFTRLVRIVTKIAKTKRFRQSSLVDLGNASVTAAGRPRLSPGRHNRNQTARSVWSAWSLLPLSNRATHPTAGASSTHSIRFARHDRPCHPSVQFAPYPPKICAKKQDFRLYYSARRAMISKTRRRAEDRRALPAAVTEALRGTIRAI